MYCKTWRYYNVEKKTDQLHDLRTFATYLRVYVYSHLSTLLYYYISGGRVTIVGRYHRCLGT